MSSSSSPEQAAAPDNKRLQLMLAVSVIVLLTHAPLLALLGQRMWNLEHYSFFPLILAGSAFLAWQRYRDYSVRIAGAVWDAGFRSPLLWLCSVALLALGVLANSPWPAGVGFLLALRASANSLLAEELYRKMLPAWWFLWLAIPLPFNFDRSLIVAMQLLATRLASGVLDLGGISHALSGVVIEVPGKSFFVEEACSGIQSLFAAISVTIFYSMLGRRGFFRTLMLVVFGIAWVVLANAARIVTVTVLSFRYNIPVDQGWAHEATGAVLFVIVMLLIVSTDRLMLFLSPLRQRGAFERDQRSHSLRRRSGSAAWTIPAAAVAGCLFALLGVVQYSRAVPIDKKLQILDRGEEIVGENSLPAEWNGWQRTNFTIVHRSATDPNGQISRVWKYQRTGQSVLFSLDGPFNRWHDLGLCYGAQGWTVDHEDDHHARDGRTYTYSELTQENEEGMQAYVLFTAFTAFGTRVSPPPFFRVGVGMRFPDATALLQQLGSTITQSDEKSPEYVGVVYQAQAFVEAQSLLTDAEREQITNLFRNLSETLRSHFEAASALDAAESED